MKHFLQSAILALAITSTFSSCETTILGENKKVQTNQKVFDMDQFQDNVEAGLGPQWVGYSYVINQNGQAARAGL
jgi:hypothetical protein